MGRAFAIGVVLNSAFVAAEVGAGLWAGSLALLADAGHNLSDVLSLILAWGAAALARRAPAGRRTYGLRKSTILASLANAVLLMVAVGAIVSESVHRLAVYAGARPCDHPAQLELHFRGGRRFPRIAAVEDDVFHPLAAKALRALLTQHPGDGVDDVALAAAVGADDGGDAAIEGQVGAIGKALESGNLEALQSHVRVVLARDIGGTARV